MELLQKILLTGLSTITDVLPIVAIIFGFQLLVLRQKIPKLKRVLVGFVYVLIGLTLFLVGLEVALFPIGKLMAQHAAAIGFATTIAEPALIAVAIKAQQVSGGTITVWGLRVAVAIGVAIGIALGAFRIVTGTPLHYYIIAGYVVVIIQTLYAPRTIIALAYDSGGVTTSTVTVPLVAALGLGLASNIPGRSALIDGFGLIAFASLSGFCADSSRLMPGLKKTRPLMMSRLLNLCKRGN